MATRLATSLYKFGNVTSTFSQFAGCQTFRRFNQPIRTMSKTSTALSGRLYSDKHEWVRVEGDKTGVIGISSYAQEALGDIVYAQLPDAGAEFSQFEECGALESVKAASELYIPVSGKVTEKNSAVEENPGIINKSCYEDGWLFKIKIDNSKELQNLMDEDAYQAFLKAQSHD